MRLFPILAAIAVIAAIYGFVFERERLLAALSQPEAPETEAMVDEGGDATPGASAETPAAVRVVAVHSLARQIDQAVTVRGRTEADRQVELRAETAGQVISAPHRKGAFVDAGEVLCEIDPGTRQSDLAEARARVTEAQSRLAEARINANAAKQLGTEGFASQTRIAATEAALRSAQAGVETARAAVAAAEREIERLTIAAPFSGLLESDSAELGSLLQPGELCATVIRLDPIMLVGFVPETAVSRVEPGAQAGGELASGERVRGEVVFISRSADPSTRTFRVEIEVPNPDLTLRDGQTAEIVIAAEGTTAHLLPQSALTLNDDGTLGVRTVDADKRVAFVPVTLLRDTPSGVWLAGLPETADVIIIGQEYVTEGVLVAPSYQEIGQ